VPIVLNASATAMFVVLTTQAPGRFSENAILLEAGTPHTVDFVPWEDELDLQLLKSSLRVEHLAEGRRSDDGFNRKTGQ
jgi:hypothetical protein